MPEESLRANYVRPYGACFTIASNRIPGNNNSPEETVGADAHIRPLC